MLCLYSYVISFSTSETLSLFLTSLQAVSIRVPWVLKVLAGWKGNLAIFQLDVRERFKKDVVIVF